MAVWGIIAGNESNYLSPVAEVWLFAQLSRYDDEATSAEPSIDLKSIRIQYLWNLKAQTKGPP